VSNSPPDSPKPVHQQQGTSQECDGILATCLDGCSSQQHSRKLTPSRTKQPHLIGTQPTSIHSLNHLHTVAAVCTIYKMHCSNSPRLLRQHLPNPRQLPSSRTRAADTWEHPHLEIPLQTTQHPDLEIYCLSLGQNPGTPSLTALWVYLHHMELQQFKKAAHHHLLKGNKGWAINAGLASDTHLL